jgi:hypothetical protein
VEAHRPRDRTYLLYGGYDHHGKNSRDKKTKNRVNLMIITLCFSFLAFMFPFAPDHLKGLFIFPHQYLRAVLK